MALRFAALCMASAGVIHLVLTPFHYAHAPAHGILFAFAGAAQVVWAVAFWRKPTLLLWNLGVLGAGALVLLWLITRFLPAPFGHGPEAVNATGVVVKVCEVIAIAALLGMLLSRRVERFAVARPGLHAILWGVSAIVAGFLLFGVASAVDERLPALGAREEAHTHHEEGAQGHSEAPATSPHQHD
ncbi:MAG: hypothetical protein ACK4K2_03575 [Dehalococcoidia bacterium]